MFVSNHEAYLNKINEPSYCTDGSLDWPLHRVTNQISAIESSAGSLYCVGRTRKLIWLPFPNNEELFNLKKETIIIFSSRHTHSDSFFLEYFVFLSNSNITGNTLHNMHYGGLFPLTVTDRKQQYYPLHFCIEQHISASCCLLVAARPSQTAHNINGRFSHWQDAALAHINSATNAPGFRIVQPHSCAVAQQKRNMHGKY